MRLRNVLAAAAVACALTTAGFAGDKQACTAAPGDCVQKLSAKYRAHGWLGIETDKGAHDLYTVKAVTAGSPAAAAGFQAGDVLLALNGVELSEANKEAIKTMKKSLAPGSQVTYSVRRQGAKKSLNATLGEVPHAVLAQWIGEHMLDQHATTRVAAK